MFPRGATHSRSHCGARLRPDRQLRWLTHQLPTQHACNSEDSGAKQRDAARLGGCAARCPADFDNQSSLVSRIVYHEVECVCARPEPARDRKGSETTEIPAPGANAGVCSVKVDARVIIRGPLAGQLRSKRVKACKTKRGLVVVGSQWPDVVAAAARTYPVRRGLVGDPVYGRRGSGC
jgi:hypothetical protein